MPSTSTLVDSIYTRRVSAGECYPPDLVKSLFFNVLSQFHCIKTSRFSGLFCASFMGQQ